jgi:hypothetical protein
MTHQLYVEGICNLNLTPYSVPEIQDRLRHVSARVDSRPLTQNGRLV